MEKNILVLYQVIRNQQQQKKLYQYPNAFIIQVSKQLTSKHIKDIFPWDRVVNEPNLSKTIRFGMKVGDDTFWLDLKDDEIVPYYTSSSISLKIS